MDRSTLLNDEFYRINTIFSLLNMSEYGRTITELQEILQLDKSVIYSDIASLLKNTKSDYVIQLDEAIAEEDQEELLDRLMQPQKSGEELNKETLVSRLKTGEYDELPFLIPSPEGAGLDESGKEKTAGISLTRGELAALSDFLKNLNRTMLGERTDSHILFKGTAPYHSEREMKLIEELERMTEKKQTAEITYRSQRGEEAWFTVRPVRLVHSMPDDVYYLIAFCEEEDDPVPENMDPGRRLTAYRVLRVERITELEEALVSLPDPDLTTLPHFEKMWGMEDGQEFHTRLRIYDEANVVAKVRHDLGERAAKLTKGEDGCYYYEDDLIGESRFRSWLRGYGSSIVVLEPKEIRDKMIETYKLVREKYI